VGPHEFHINLVTLMWIPCHVFLQITRPLHVFHFFLLFNKIQIWSNHTSGSYGAFMSSSWYGHLLVQDYKL
jgi:hypothetical protein